MCLLCLDIVYVIYRLFNESTLWIVGSAILEESMFKIQGNIASYVSIASAKSVSYMCYIKYTMY